jgi:hypothetical protein
MLSFSAIHVRGRNPDADRKPVKLVHYIRAADRHAAILAMHGKRDYVCMYVCMYGVFFPVWIRQVAQSGRCMYARMTWSQK